MTGVCLQSVPHALWWELNVCWPQNWGEDIKGEYYQNSYQNFLSTLSLLLLSSHTFSIYHALSPSLTTSHRYSISLTFCY